MRGKAPIMSRRTWLALFVIVVARRAYAEPPLPPIEVAGAAVAGPAALPSAAAALALRAVPRAAAGSIHTTTKTEEAVPVITARREPTIEDFLAVIQARVEPGMKRCYRTALRRDDTLSAPKSLRLTIDTTGAVSAATVKLGGGAALDACVTRVVRAVHFPAPSAPVELSLPLH